MSSRLEELAARRRVLQARCAEQRGDVGVLYGDIEHVTGRADRVIETVRSLAPVVAVGGIALLFVVGPGRALHLLRRGLTAGLYATQALRLVR
jgi:hypothetical protein